MSFEDSKNVASIYALGLLLEGKITTWEEMMKKIEAVRANDVLATAQEIFSPKGLNLAIIGPYKDPEKFRKILKI